MFRSLFGKWHGWRWFSNCKYLRFLRAFAKRSDVMNLLLFSLCHTLMPPKTPREHRQRAPILLTMIHHYSSVLHPTFSTVFLCTLRLFENWIEIRFEMFKHLSYCCLFSFVGLLFHCIYLIAYMLTLGIFFVLCIILHLSCSLSQREQRRNGRQASERKSVKSALFGFRNALLLALAKVKNYQPLQKGKCW